MLQQRRRPRKIVEPEVYDFDTPSRRGWTRIFTLRFWWWVATRIGLPLLVIFLVGSYLYAQYGLPSIEETEEFLFPQASVIYARQALEEPEKKDQYALYRLHGGENRAYVPLSEISQHMIDATLAAEDDQFFSHHGVDFPALIKAVAAQLGIGPPRGGSTITQQLMKNVFLDSRQQLTRKYKEALLAFKTEAYYTKEQILELYLNKIFMGSNAYGVEAAAQTFFAKKAADLSICESSVLAALLKLPTRLNPYGPGVGELMGVYETDEEGNPTGAFTPGRKDMVLRRMLEEGFITQAEHDQAVEECRTLEFQQTKSDIRAAHFVFLVQQQVAEKYGEDILTAGGLQIYTTLDWDLQQIAEDTIAEKTTDYKTKYNASNAALATINPENGEILAYVGGRDYFDDEADGKVDVLQSKRQPGSSFKPLVYATAFTEAGLGAGTVLWDVPTDFGAGYTPQNFSGNFTGPVTVRRALNESLNIPAIKAATLAGPENILQMATTLGIDYAGDADIHGVALGVGVAEVNILGHINSFSAFAGDGSWYTPSSLLEIHDSDDMVLDTYDTAANKHEGLDPEVAALVRNILTDENSRPVTDGFAWNKLLQLEQFNNGVKTGTSNKRVPNPRFNASEPAGEGNPKEVIVPGDSWTIGFTPYLVTGVWVGNNDGSGMEGGATGLTVAAPIWKRYMEDAHQNLLSRGTDPQKTYKEPTLLTPVVIDKYTGKRANELTPEGWGITEYFTSFGTPSSADDLTFTEEEYDMVLLQPVSDFTPAWAKGMVKKAQLHSYRPDWPTWEAPVQTYLAKSDQFIDYGLTPEELEARRAMTEEERLALYATLMDAWQATQEEIPSTQAPATVPTLDPSRIRNQQYLERLRQSQPSTTAPSRPDTEKFRDELETQTSAAGDALEILNPKDGALIAPGSLTIQPKIQSYRSPEKVEYYWNNELLHVKQFAPWSLQLELDNRILARPTHTIRVVVTDRSGTSREATVTVRTSDALPDAVSAPPITRPPALIPEESATE
ncbi:penicillin-binding protein [Candidatus Peribacteria bacterium]|nr:penicillin-binding protein [Candidatus Peribacteria bacterium]